MFWHFILERHLKTCGDAARVVSSRLTNSVFMVKNYSITVYMWLNTVGLKWDSCHESHKEGVWKWLFVAFHNLWLNWPSVFSKSAIKSKKVVNALNLKFLLLRNYLFQYAPCVADRITSFVGNHVLTILVVLMRKCRFYWSRFTLFLTVIWFSVLLTTKTAFLKLLVEL